MAPVSTNTRKRSRSESDFEFETQSKQFINEKIVDMNNVEKMKEIHDKTLKLLFQNGKEKHAKNGNEAIPENLALSKWQQFGEKVCLLGNGSFKLMGNNTNNQPTGQSDARRCKYCAKPSDLQAVDCINCNLELCESCGISCEQCNAPLCICCVKMFDCCDNSIDMNPCCLRCKQIYHV